MSCVVVVDVDVVVYVVFVLVCFRSRSGVHASSPVNLTGVFPFLFSSPLFSSPITDISPGVRLVCVVVSH